MTDLIKLARRWHQVESFRYAPGMVVAHDEHSTRARLVEAVYLGEKYPDEYDEYDISAEAVIIERPDGGNNVATIHPSDMWSWIPDLSDPATAGLLEYQVMELYGGDQFVMRANRAPKMGGEQEIRWIVQDWRSAGLFYGSVVLVGAEHAKIACLVDALERYEEVE